MDISNYNLDQIFDFARCWLYHKDDITSYPDTPPYEEMKKIALNRIFFIEAQIAGRKNLDTQHPQA